MSELLQDVSLILFSSMLLSLGFLSFSQPPLLGYILAGILIGPAFGQIIEDTSTIKLLGEFGMILLLFLVGLELSLAEFKKVWVSTLICLSIHIASCLLIATGLKIFLSWSASFSLFVAFNLSLSSTAVVVTLLENLGLLQSKKGSFAVSLLIAQDLSLMPMILILRTLSSENVSVSSFLNLILALGLLIFSVLFFGKKRPTNTKYISKQQSLLNRPEIATLIGGSLCFAFASMADFFKLSAAYGAFLAGLMLGNRWERDLLLQSFIPITSMMMMVFFLSVGMNFSLSFLINYWVAILIVLIILTFMKVSINFLGFLAVKWPWRQALFLSVLMGQLSEFSFVLIEEAYKNNLITYYTTHFFTVLTTLSLAFGSILPIGMKLIQDKKDK